MLARLTFIEGVAASGVSRLLRSGKAAPRSGGITERQDLAYLARLGAAVTGES